MMHFLLETLNRFRSFFRKQPLDHELDMQMASHIEMAIEENLRRGCRRRRRGGRHWFNSAGCNRRVSTSRLTRAALARRADARSPLHVSHDAA